jgi:pSer/pThr/pTyr-binding forkhead associated (FHA) protein
MTNARENRETRPALPPGAPGVRLWASGEEGPLEYKAPAPVILIGGRRDCNLTLPHPDVSKIHTAIVNTGRAVLVCDLCSRTGTFVNGQVVQRGFLRPGDALRVGPVEVGVEITGDSNQSAAEPVAPLALEYAGEEFELTDSAAVIGRRNTADLIVDTPDVSLAHALIFSLNGRPAICDLGSRSGTLVNGDRIELSWLADGDEVEIGGETLTVHWTAPQKPAASAAVAVPAVQFSESLASGVAAGLPAGSLAELEQTIAAVHAQISAARARIDERSRAVEQREAALAQQMRELAARQEALEQAEATIQERASGAEAAERAADEKLKAAAQREAAIVGRQSELDAAQAALAAQQQGLAEATEACCRREEELTRNVADLEARMGQLVEQERALQQERAALAAAQSELAELRALLDSREGELLAREQLIASRAEQEAAVAKRLEEFKRALSEAGTLFAAVGSAGTPAAATGQPAAAGSGHDDAGMAGDELPAPVVDEPLFSATASGPPPDWPPELRQRFRVLRRMSKLSDEELMAQVWEDRARLMQSQESAKPPAGKKKRRLWGN